MMKFFDDTTELEIDSCPECFGLWFDREELKQMFQSPQLSKQILKEDALAKVLKPESDVGREGGPRNCPVCSEQELISSKVGNIQTDYCLGCYGIWLDRSELEDLVEAYRRGERGNLIILNQLAEGLGTASNPNPKAKEFIEAMERYTQGLTD